MSREAISFFTGLFGIPDVCRLRLDLCLQIINRTAATLNFKRMNLNNPNSNQLSCDERLNYTLKRFFTTNYHSVYRSSFSYELISVPSQVIISDIPTRGRNLQIMSSSMLCTNIVLIKRTAWHRVFLYNLIVIKSQSLS